MEPTTATPKFGLTLEWRPDMKDRAIADDSIDSFVEATINAEVPNYEAPNGFSQAVKVNNLLVLDAFRVAMKQGRITHLRLEALPPKEYRLKHGLSGIQRYTVDADGRWEENNCPEWIYDTWQKYLMELL